VIEPVASTASGAAQASAAKPDAVSRGFEQLLVQQLAKELLKTTGESGGAYASLLPSALADSIEDAGGLGLDLGIEGARS
jgi:hypothetical protein